MSLEDESKKIWKKLEEEENLKIKIAFFGQPGAGKSSLINCIIGADIAKVSAKTDTTRIKEEYNWNNLTLVDLPGYGTTMFPASTYVDQFGIKDYDVLICVSGEGKFTEADVSLYKAMLGIGKRCIFVRNKLDALKEKGKTKDDLMKDILDDLADKVEASVPIIFTDTFSFEGLSALQDAIIGRLELVKQDRYFRSAKAYSKAFLDAKREACYRYVTYGAAASATGNLVPVPGLGIGVDVTAIISLFLTVRHDFGLNDANLATLEKMAPTLGPAINNFVRLASTQGVRLLLEKFAGQVTIKEMSKYVPIVGQAIGAGMAFALVKTCGNKYVGNCYELAEKQLDLEFQRRASGA